MTNKKVHDFDEEDKNFQEEESDGVEDLDEILLKTERKFNLGNESASKYESSPEEILRDYQDFN